MQQKTRKKILLDLYHFLYDAFGPQQWWPMDTSHHHNNNTDPRFEIVIGAILTQNTAWTNVEKAIAQLKHHHLLSIHSLCNAESSLIKNLIRSSGYFNQKAKRLKLLAAYLEKNYQADLSKFFSQPLSRLRNELLNIHGIGPETADSILLYAAEKPIFVVDAYTKRLCKRLPLPVNPTSYDNIQHYFQKEFAQKYSEEDLVKIYNEFHALIVNLGKFYCKPKPICAKCPIIQYCTYGKEQVKSSQ